MDEEEAAQQHINISVFTPILYLVVLLTCFVAFSVIYRKRKVKNLTNAEQIFDENYSLTIYNTLKQQYNDPDLPKDQKPHEKVMKAALLKRAVEAIRRSLRLKESEPVYKNLYQNGLIGDDLFQQFNIQVKFQELEIKEIAQDCEVYKKNWSQLFFKVAQEICFNEALRRRLFAMDDRAKDLAELWQGYVNKSENDANKTNAIEEKINSKLNASDDSTMAATSDSKVADSKPSKKNKKKN